MKPKDYEKLWSKLKKENTQLKKEILQLQHENKVAHLLNSVLDSTINELNKKLMK